MKRCPECGLPVVSIETIEDGWSSYRCFAGCTPQTLMQKKTYPHTNKIAPDHDGDETMKWIPSSVQPPPEDGGYIFACFTLLDDETGALYLFRECRFAGGR